MRKRIKSDTFSQAEYEIIRQALRQSYGSQTRIKPMIAKLDKLFSQVCDFRPELNSVDERPANALWHLPNPDSAQFPANIHSFEAINPNHTAADHIPVLSGWERVYRSIPDTAGDDGRIVLGFSKAVPEKPSKDRVCWEKRLHVGHNQGRQGVLFRFHAGVHTVERRCDQVEVILIIEILWWLRLFSGW